MAGIDIDGGGIDMFPDQAGAAIAAFQKVAADIQSMLDRRITQIAGLDSQLGKGQAGARFGMSYQPFVDQVVPQLRELVTATQGHGDNGMTCVSQYVRQDMVNRGIVENVEPGQ